MAGDQLSKSLRAREVLMLAVWFGGMAGLLEGVVLIAFQELRWQGWGQLDQVIDENIFWASPLVNILLFLLVGILVATIQLLAPRVQGGGNWGSGVFDDELLCAFLCNRATS